MAVRYRLPTPVIDASENDKIMLYQVLNSLWILIRRMLPEEMKILKTR